MTGVAARPVTTFGEMLLRLSPAGHSALFASERMRAGFGGAEANVAVSLAHLGVPCRYVTRVPANLIGDAAVAVLRAEGVETGQVLRGPERMGLYFVEPGADVGNSRVVYDRTGSAFAAIVPGTIDWPTALIGAGWFHATGITAALGPGPLGSLGAAIAAARGCRVPVSIDLNYRPALWRDRDPAPVVRPLVQGIDLLIGNPHSVRAMLGLDATDEAFGSAAGRHDVALRIAGACECRRVALTRREVLGGDENRWGASLFDAASGELVSSRTWTVGVVDRIGGGDAFAAALIAATQAGRPMGDAVEFAAAASVLKLRVTGDFNRVTVPEVDAFLATTNTTGRPANAVGA